MEEAKETVPYLQRGPAVLADGGLPHDNSLLHSTCRINIVEEVEEQDGAGKGTDRGGLRVQTEPWGLKKQENGTISSNIM